MRVISSKAKRCRSWCR